MVPASSRAATLRIETASSPSASASSTPAAAMRSYDRAPRAGCAARRRIGLAGQHTAVDEKPSGRQNLVLFGRHSHLPGRAVRQRAAELLDQFGLAAVADRPASTYSGGLRRRLDLAASLLVRPA